MLFNTTPLFFPLKICAYEYQNQFDIRHQWGWLCVEMIVYCCWQFDAAVATIVVVVVAVCAKRITSNYLELLVCLIDVALDFAKQMSYRGRNVIVFFFFLIPRLPPLFGASLHRPRPRAHSYSLDCWMIEQTSIRIRFTRKHLAIWLLVQQMWPYRCRSQIRLCRSLDHQTVYIYVCMYQNSIRMSTYKTSTSTRVSIELIFCCRWLLSARLSPPPPPRLLRFRALISIEWMYVDTYLYI